MRLPYLTPALVLVLSVMGAAHAGEPHFPADAPLASREGGTAEGADPTSPSTEQPAKREFWVALGEVTAINVGAWSFDRYVLNADYARISLSTWEQNLRGGFVWDNDEFGTNQFAHPYHGSLYYNAARDNGFGYLGSSLFTLLGSLQWELFGENERPSINDLANTTLGGIALGEVLYRLSSEVLDDEATGLSRFWHELSGAALSPSRGLNRLVHGRSWKISPSPPEASPSRDLTLVWQLGYLKLANEEALTEGTDQLFAQLVLQYGDPVYEELRRPFDAYSVEAQFTTKEHRLVSHAQIRGVLASTSLMTAERSRLVLGALQHFDYTNVQAYEVGGQSFSGSLLYARQHSEEDFFRAELHLKGVVLGGISTDHSPRPSRSYDYGPGLDLQMEARYLSREWEIATAEAGIAWIHTLNGSASQHLFIEGKVQVDLPVYRSLGVGMSAILFQRNSFFREAKDTTQRTSQLRVFLSLH